MPRCGIAYLYAGSADGTSWQLQARLAPPTRKTMTDFGYAVALDGSGGLAVVQADDRLYFFRP